ncbi:FxsC protein [Paractinoplanes durhamensis]|uniref:FxsC protein n=1 Tax=Paractinoplanes durhamensis TaxID=113563 RepID=UPI00363282B1
MAAPAGDGIPPGRDPATYGPEPQAWRPFGAAQTSPLVQYVVHTAERLGLSSETVALTTEPAAASHSATLVLIDPWAGADQAGRAALARAVRALPEWALCVVLVNRSDRQYRTGGAELPRLVADTVGRAEPLDVMGVDDLQQFVDGLPVLVTEARRRYLMLGPKFTPKGATAIPTQQRKNDS